MLFMDLSAAGVMPESVHGISSEHIELLREYYSHHFLTNATLKFANDDEEDRRIQSRPECWPEATGRVTGTWLIKGAAQESAACMGSADAVVVVGETPVPDEKKCRLRRRRGVRASTPASSDASVDQVVSIRNLAVTDEVSL